MNEFTEKYWKIGFVIPLLFVFFEPLRSSVWLAFTAFILIGILFTFINLSLHNHTVKDKPTPPSKKTPPDEDEGK